MHPTPPRNTYWLGRRLVNRTMRELETRRLLDLLLRGRSFVPRRSLVVLTYHRIADKEPVLDDGVVSASPAEFAEQMGMLRERATPLSIDQVADILRHRLPVPDNAVLVTFDDGYRDNWESALPILRRLGVPATFFVATGFIETGRLPWWDRISYITRHAPTGTIRIRYPANVDLRVDSAWDRHQAKRTLLRMCKHVYQLDFDRFFAGLEQAAGLVVDEAALAEGLFMNWEQVRDLQQAGMDIGAHTHSHRVLQTLSFAEVHEEICLSRRLLGERLGIVPRSLAYPVGFPVSGESGLRGVIEEAGFEIGFAFVPGYVVPGKTDLLNLPRYAVERETPARFKTALAAPSLLF